MGVQNPQFYQDLLNHVQDPVFVKNEQKVFVFVNDALAKFVGLTAEEMIGKTDADFYPPEEAEIFYSTDEQVFKTGQPNINEEDLTNTQNERFSISTKKTLYVTPTGVRYLVGVIRDITEIKQLQDQLLESNSNLEIKVQQRTTELENKNKELEHFAYITSHDLQEPLRTISSFSALLQRRYRSKLDEVGIKSLDFIQNSSERMRLLITDILTYSQIGQPSIPELMDLNKLVEHVIEDMKATIVETRTSIQVGSLPKVVGNRRELQSLFQNLISNAIKYRKENLDPKVILMATENPNEWQFSIKDNGIGIEEKHKEKVFKIFQRLHNRDQYQGTGIGLAHCKKIVENHKGCIWCDSIPNEGSTFFFSIKKVSIGSNENLKTHNRQNK